ncbi:cytochrome P450 [Streptomyces sp. NPDC002209]|uniref:cytochrome P450 n=1 Tax=Streptomyces sp. NPDC002209 TaxID=3364638 RepID=UPI0036A46436
MNVNANVNHEPLTSLPTARPAGCPFAPPGELAEVRERQPVRRMVYPDGHHGWLVTGYAPVRAVLADPRFSSRYELMHFPFPGGPEGALPPAPVGDMTGMDAPDHTRYRRLLAGRFTARRMRLPTRRIEQITTEHLDAMGQQGAGADLVQAFAQPIPTLVICELLGVPYGDRKTFHDRLADSAVEELMRYLSVAHTMVRVALEDVELDGRTVRAGESVTLSVEAANRDPLRFADPDTLDIRRKATGQLGFGHGVHQCLGAQLARVEMRVALPALLDRFPGLRLAVPAADVPLRTGMNIHGVHRLPVTLT